MTKKNKKHSRKKPKKIAVRSSEPPSNSGGGYDPSLSDAYANHSDLSLAAAEARGDISTLADFYHYSNGV